MKAKTDMKAKKRKEINALRSKWRKALRSGRYKQTTGALARQGIDASSSECSPRAGKSFCCLGVAALVCRLPQCASGLLDIANAKLLGLSRNTMNDLAELNDLGKATFKHIAAHKLLRNLKAR
jgi:hypothetical protein